VIKYYFLFAAFFFLRLAGRFLFTSFTFLPAGTSMHLRVAFFFLAAFFLRAIGFIGLVK
jgi:hypothetical protein